MYTKYNSSEGKIKDKKKRIGGITNYNSNDNEKLSRLLDNNPVT